MTTKQQVIHIEYWTKKYPLIITSTTDPEFKNDEWVIHVRCDAANLNQEYCTEDLMWLIENLPDYIKDAQEIGKKENFIKIRVSPKEKWKLETLAKSNWYKNISSYIRAKALQTA
jgi:hypothetical protein